MTEIFFIDLFAGIGGFAEGFRRAGLKFKYHAFAEIDKGAISIYKKHFPDAKELGDVKTIGNGYFSELRNQRGGGRTSCHYCGFPLPRSFGCWKKARIGRLSKRVVLRNCPDYPVAPA